MEALCNCGDHVKKRDKETELVSNNIEMSDCFYFDLMIFLFSLCLFRRIYKTGQTGSLKLALIRMALYINRSSPYRSEASA